MTQEASKVSKTALVVLCLQMEASSGVWSCGTGSDVVIVAYYMTTKCDKRYKETRNWGWDLGWESC
jgi:hypothetical protein